MKRALREQIQAIRSEAEAMGVPMRGWAYGSKHPFVALDCDGEELRVFMANSPSAGLENVVKNCRRKTRRMIERARGQNGPNAPACSTDSPVEAVSGSRTPEKASADPGAAPALSRHGVRT